MAEQPKYGYQIEQDIAARGMRDWTEIGFSSIYYVLNKLEAAGWLASESAAPWPVAEGEQITQESSPAQPPAANHRSSDVRLADRRSASSRSGPTRKVYHLTEAGWAGYQAAVRERLARPRPHTGDFDLALANLPALPPAEASAALETHLAHLRERLARVRAKWAQDRAGAQQAGYPFPTHVDALFDHSIAGIEGEIAWVEKYLGN